MKPFLKKLSTLKTKRNLYIVLGILLVIVLVVFFVFYKKSPSNKPDPDDDNYYSISSLEKQIITDSDSDSDVVITIPKTQKEEANTILSTQALEFAKKVNSTYTLGTIEYTYEPRVFDDFLFATLSTVTQTIDTTPVFTVIGIDKKDPIDYTTLFTSGYETPITNSVMKTLSERFSLQNEIGSRLTKEALINHTYRIASNGIVILIPTKELGSQTFSSMPYYEVLVPNEIIKDFINY